MEIELWIPLSPIGGVRLWRSSEFPGRRSDDKPLDFPPRAGQRIGRIHQIPRHLTLAIHVQDLVTRMYAAAYGLSRELTEEEGGCFTPLSARNDELWLLSSRLPGVGEILSESSAPCLRVSKMVCIPFIFRLGF